MNPQQKITVYAALDGMSTASFVSKDVWMRLGSPGDPTKISIKTLTDEQQQSTVVVNNLSITSVNGDKSIRLPKVYTQDLLPFDVSEIPSREALDRWPHLRCLISEIPDVDKDVPIGLLIGVDCPLALQPHDVIHSVDNGPFAIRTALGWCISGPKQRHDEQMDTAVMSCNHVRISDQIVQTTESGLKEMVLQMYEADFNEPTSEMKCVSVERKNISALSQDDRKFLDIMNNESRFVNGHHHLPLPFRLQDIHMPNNRSQALQRIQGIKRRFARDQIFREDYIKFMQDIIDKGYMRKVKPESMNENSNGRCWYLPDHGIYHPQKPVKIRVAVDCSCQYNGASLNKELFQGPDLTNPPVGVLMRFRQERFGFMAGIECMLCQVRISELQTEDRWPKQPHLQTALDADPDVHKQVTIFASNGKRNVDNRTLENIFTAGSSWYGLERNVAWILVIIDQLNQESKRLPVRDLLKHQIILPGSHHVNAILVRPYHELSEHSGELFVYLSLVRDGF